jgi:hypothetical protein
MVFILEQRVLGVLMSSCGWTLLVKGRGGCCQGLVAMV